MKKNKNEKEDVTYYGITILTTVTLFGIFYHLGFDLSESILFIGLIGIVALIVDTIDFLAI